MEKKIIRIGTKRKPKPTKKERCLTGDIQTNTVNGDDLKYAIPEK